MVYRYWIQRIAFFIGIFATTLLIYWNWSNDQVAASLTDEEVDRIIELTIKEATKKSESYQLLKPYQSQSPVNLARIKDKETDAIETSNTDAIDDLDSEMGECELDGECSEK